MVHSDLSRRMWWTTFRGAIESRNMFITKITMNKTIRYNVNLLASHCFIITANIRFLNTSVFANLLIVCRSEFMVSVS